MNGTTWKSSLANDLYPRVIRCGAARGTSSLTKESRWRGANDSTQGACAPRKRRFITPAPLRKRNLRRRNILPAAAQHPRHPNQFVEEFCSPSDKAFIDQFAVFAKNFGGISKINVVENGDEPELAHYRQKRLDHTRTSERTG